MYSRNTTSNLGDLSKDVKLASKQEDSVSALSWSPTANVLAVASWDSKVRVYDLTKTNTGECIASINFNGPALRLTDGMKVIGAGADKTAFLLDLSNGGSVQQQVAVHDAPIRSVKFFEHPNSNTPMIITGSCDKTVKYWDVRAETGKPAGVLNTQDRVYVMDVNTSLLVIGDADQNLYIVNLNQPNTFFRTRKSPLKYQTRAVSCFMDATGFVMGSIEGRGAFQWISDREYSAKSYTFKCHRNPSTTSANTTDIYAVNAMSTHPKHGTFSTAGSDGTFQFWDKDRKCRLKEYPKVGGQISATGFNFDGSKFAYAVSYDWSEGFASHRPDSPNWIGIHTCLKEDVEPRAASSRR